MKRLSRGEYLTLQRVSLVIFPDDQLLPVQDIICCTDLSGPNNILGHRSQSGSTGRLRQNEQTRPKGALKDVELACEPWPTNADGSGRIKKSPTLLGPGEVQSGRSDARKHRTSFRQQMEGCRRFIYGEGIRR